MKGRKMGQQDELLKLKNKLVSEHNKIMAELEEDDFNKGLAAGLARAVYAVQEMLESGV